MELTKRILKGVLISGVIGAIMGLIAVAIRLGISPRDMQASVWLWVLIGAGAAASGGGILALLSDEDRASKLLERLPPGFVFPAFLIIMIAPIIAAVVESKEKYQGWAGVAIIGILAAVLLVALSLAFWASRSDAERVLALAYAIEVLTPPVQSKLVTVRGQLTQQAVIALGFKIWVWQNSTRGGVTLEEIATNRLHCDIELLQHIQRLFLLTAAQAMYP